GDVGAAPVRIGPEGAKQANRGVAPEQMPSGAPSNGAIRARGAAINLQSVALANRQRQRAAGAIEAIGVVCSAAVAVDLGIDPIDGRQLRCAPRCRSNWRTGPPCVAERESIQRLPFAQDGYVTAHDLSANICCRRGRGSVGGLTLRMRLRK